jgi:hypothetical protein
MSPTTGPRLVEKRGWVETDVERQKAGTSLRTDATEYDRSSYSRPATKPFSEIGNTLPLPGLLQDLTPRLLAFFQARGYGPAVAKVLAQKLSGELIARLRAYLSGTGMEAATELGVVTVGDLKLDLKHRLFCRGDAPIHLSPKEFDVLALLMTNPDVPITPVKLLRSVWGFEYGGELDYLRTVVCTLRKKIEKNPSDPEYIVSEPWIGYRCRTPNGPVPPRRKGSRQK